MDFGFFISYSSLTEVNFLGSNYTWWNERVEEDCIFKRLDRVLANDTFMELFPSSDVQHLMR